MICTLQRLAFSILAWATLSLARGRASYLLEQCLGFDGWTLNLSPATSMRSADILESYLEAHNFTVERQDVGALDEQGIPS